ncbi:uncharacterized protein PHALS_05669 [Plasmopara halstedii]|uniref:Uncharacterized protein n=1 Tax=Plasmopara halstedii TaxID=4781 RepID=A0A0P1B2E1_PLAHL|nr:uncharacterized protein PHALS_05669 [Plasmopara halstedii]CEG48199.1 hypothetical protein PHALS_05669 [Plasmopara halstedii]|eukprot:XP_024584568.1 hypothetical protein PHALS_05669 [Plasmopara halstedii]
MQFRLIFIDTSRVAWSAAQQLIHAVEFRVQIRHDLTRNTLPAIYACTRA